jgi:hypothetical protein
MPIRGMRGKLVGRSVEKGSVSESEEEMEEE